MEFFEQKVQILVRAVLALGGAGFWAGCVAFGVDIPTELTTLIAVCIGVFIPQLAPKPS